ncbi:hypothetical protein GQ53DRAFT_712568 [Thozetella sp. PMI_491]|nr:hypothetical protein GQ53DRAFT_712568 [Thozetella sp. PMI_491]
MSSTATAIIGQAPTNLGPLTTTFTPPPSCTVAVGAVEGGLLGLGLLGASVQNFAFLGQSCSAGKGIDATSCWPPTSKGAKAPSTPLGGWGYYSPGLNCPVGYATACSATGGSGGGSGWPVQFKLMDGETAIGCCPSGYGCANLNGQTCTMVATSTTVPTVTCDGTKSGAFAFQTVPDAKASITAFSLFAPMIQINFQSSDQPKQTSAPASSTSVSDTAKGTTTAGSSSGTSSVIAPPASDTSAPPASETLVTDGSQTPPADTPAETGTGTTSSDGPASASNTAGLQSAENLNSGNGGLAPMTVVGLGVGGGVAALALIASVGIYLWKRKKSRQEEEELDRLYGMKGLSSPHDPVRNDDIPGWYRGQRPTPTADRFRPAASELVGNPYHRDF